MVIRYCLVRNCDNNTWETPNKLFIRVPVDLKTKETWFKAMNVEPTRSQKNNFQFCCEDHFDLQNDAENFTKFKLIGGRLLLKKTSVPHLNLNKNNKNTEETQFTLSAKELQQRNIKALQLNPSKPAKKKAVSKTICSSLPSKPSSTATSSDSPKSSVTLTDKEIETDLNQEFVYALCQCAINHGINEFEIQVNKKKQNGVINLNIEETNINSLQSSTKTNIENGNTIKENINLSLPVLKQEAEINLEDGIKEFIVLKDCVNQDIHLKGQDIDIELNNEEKDKIPSLSWINEADKILITTEDSDDEKQQLTNQIMDINLILEEKIVKQETEKSFEDTLNNKEKLIATKNEQSASLEINIDINMEENNKKLIIQEKERYLKDCTNINEKVIKIEDPEDEVEQLTSQKMDINLNINDKNITLVKQETEIKIENDLTLKEEFTAIENNQQFLNHEQWMRQKIGISNTKEDVEDFEVEFTTFEDSRDTELIKRELELINAEEIESKGETDKTNCNNSNINEAEISLSKSQPFEFVNCNMNGNSVDKFGQSFTTNEKISYIYNRYSPTNKNKELSCYICNEVFPDNCLLNKHVNMHEKSKRFECSICKKRFRANCFLKQHMKIHTGVKAFKCLVCSKLFLMKSYLKRHLEQKDYKCIKCNKKFVIRCALKKHIKLQHPEEYKCFICRKQFPGIFQLKFHINSVHFSSSALKKFECHICTKKFTMKYQLDDHIDWHTGIKRHQCLNCNKRFGQRDSLIPHRNICPPPDRMLMT